MTKRMKVAFLYNHEAGHQARHSAVVIPALIAAYPSIDVTVLATSDALLETVRGICGGDVGGKCRFVILAVPGWHKPIARVLDPVVPFSRLDHLYSNRALFASFDAVIVTEGTSLFLRKLQGLEHLKILRIDHGAGDRSIGFQPSYGGNDLVLLAGPKLRDRFLQLGYLRPDQIAVVGYPKFDSVDVPAAAHANSSPMTNLSCFTIRIPSRACRPGTTWALMCSNIFTIPKTTI